MLWNWIDLLFVGPFLVAMSYNPIPMIMRLIGGAIIVINLIMIMENSGMTMWQEQQPKMGSPLPAPRSFMGQSQVGYSISGRGQGRNALFNYE